MVTAFTAAYHSPSTASAQRRMLRSCLLWRFSGVALSITKFTSFESEKRCRRMTK